MRLPAGETKIYDVVQQLALPDSLVLDAFRIDAIDVGRAYNTSTDAWKPFMLADGSPALIPKWFDPIKLADGSYETRTRGHVISAMPVGATFFDQTYFPYVDGYPSDYKDLDAHMDMVLWKAHTHAPWDHISDTDFWRDLRSKALGLRAESTRALVLVCGCNLFEWGTFLRRMDNFLCDLLLEPDEVCKLLDELMARHLEILKNVCRAVGDVVDIVRFGDDLGMDTGPFMQPDIYRRIFKPRHALLCDYVHRHSTMRTFLHSCGSIYKLMPDLIEAGFDIINPVQFAVRDMDPERLKREFGRDITFWGGGCDTRKVLNHGAPREVYDHVRRMIDIMAPGGGFVFNTVHNIMPDVPPQNIVSMFEAVDEYGR